MSQNLHIHINNQEIEIYQTPTQITEMCMCTHDGVATSLTRNAAKRGIMCYIAYIKGSLNGSYKSIQEYDEKKTHIDEHVDHLQNLVKLGTKFYIYQR